MPIGNQLPTPEAMTANLRMRHPTTGLPMRVALVLSLAAFINYVDRGNVVTAAPLLKDYTPRLSQATRSVVFRPSRDLARFCRDNTVDFHRLDLSE